jgi:hypothetical protein
VERATTGSNESGIIEAAVRIERLDLVRDHPLCHRLAREPLDRVRIARIRQNLGVGLGRPSPDTTRDAGLDEPGALAAGRALQANLDAIAESSEPNEWEGVMATTSSLAADLETVLASLEEPSSPGHRGMSEQAEPGSSRIALALDEMLASPEMAAAWRGSKSAIRAMWQFLDDLYALCYPRAPTHTQRERGPSVPDVHTSRRMA